MSEAEDRLEIPLSPSMEGRRQELLEDMRPLPPYEEMRIDDLTDEEEELFFEALRDA